MLKSNNHPRLLYTAVKTEAMRHAPRVLIVTYPQTKGYRERQTDPGAGQSALGTPGWPVLFAAHDLKVETELRVSTWLVRATRRPQPLISCVTSGKTVHPFRLSGLSCPRKMVVPLSRVGGRVRKSV